MRSTLPSRSPTTVLSWQRATRSRLTPPAYGVRPARRQCASPVRAGRTPATLGAPCSPPTLDELIERSAAPAAVRPAVERIADEHPGATERLATDVALAAAIVAVAGASRHLARLVECRPGRPRRADRPRRAARRSTTAPSTTSAGGRTTSTCGSPPATCSASTASTPRSRPSRRWPPTCLAGRRRARPGPTEATRLAVIGMGKLGGGELNYASDIDVMFVGEGDAGLAGAPRPARDGRRPLVLPGRRQPAARGPRRPARARRSASYEAYWDRWAEPWEFQALLKARAVAGDVALGAAFDAASAAACGRAAFSADDLRSPAPPEGQDRGRPGPPGPDRPRGEAGPGRHPRHRVRRAAAAARARAARRRAAVARRTLAALAELAGAGLRRSATTPSSWPAPTASCGAVEHRLQLYDGAQVHAMPADEADRTRIARTLGFRDAAGGHGRSQQLDADARPPPGDRARHPRAPLLPAAARGLRRRRRRAAGPARAPIEARLAAFGFSDGLRTRAAVRELTRGLTRTSRLMQQMLPLLLGWLCETPRPRPRPARRCATSSPTARGPRSWPAPSASRPRRPAALPRSSAPAAWPPTSWSATSTSSTAWPTPTSCARCPKAELVERARLAAGVAGRRRRPPAAPWRGGRTATCSAIMARDVLGRRRRRRGRADVTALAEASLEVGAGRAGAGAAVRGHRPRPLRRRRALLRQRPRRPVRLRRHDGRRACREAERLAMSLAPVRRRAPRRPTRIWDVDADLRPEGKQGPLARSVEGYAAYFARWALVWERQAMLRARPVAGDPAVAARVHGPARRLRVGAAPLRRRRPRDPAA